jgi:hypothetical protein
MGEMADYLIEQGLDDWCPAPRTTQPKPTTTCKHCGVSGLRWIKTEAGTWKLYAGSEPHKCHKPAHKVIVRRRN